MRQISLAVALLLSSSALAQAPGIVWEHTYSQFTQFRAVCAMPDGTYLAAGSGSAGDFCRLDGAGTVIDTIDVPLESVLIYAVEPLPDGGVIATGKTGADWSLVLVRLDPDGGILWIRTYGWEGTNETGQDVEPLDDGGFGVCGYRSVAGQQYQAWTMRTDSSGDTLWTRTLGAGYNDYALGLEAAPEGLVVACTAALSSPPQHAVLAVYNLDGQLLGLHGYPQLFSGSGAADICRDEYGGFTFITHYFNCDGWTVHVDEDYQYVWDVKTPWNCGNRSWRIHQTMDLGYIVARQDDWVSDPDPPPSYDDWNAALSRYDSSGNELWSLSLERPDSCFFHDVVQLSTGGYIAAGRIRTPAQNGYIVRFEPEEGVGQPVISSCLAIESCIPNPGTSVFTVDWSSAVSGTAFVRVFDISGRLRLEQELGLIPEGEHSTQIDLQNEPSGCYLVVVYCGPDRASTKLVVLR